MDIDNESNEVLKPISITPVEDLGRILDTCRTLRGLGVLPGHVGAMRADTLLLLVLMGNYTISIYYSI